MWHHHTPHSASWVASFALKYPPFHISIYSHTTLNIITVTRLAVPLNTVSSSDNLSLSLLVLGSQFLSPLSLLPTSTLLRWEEEGRNQWRLLLPTTSSYLPPPPSIGNGLLGSLNTAPSAHLPPPICTGNDFPFVPTLSPPSDNLNLLTSFPFSY